MASEQNIIKNRLDKAAENATKLQAEIDELKLVCPVTVIVFGKHKAKFCIKNDCPLFLEGCTILPK